MNWKRCTAVFISAVLLILPQNMTGCVEPPSPFDYYTSFFSRGFAKGKNFEPFYYTKMIRFYDEWDSLTDDDGYDLLGDWQAQVKGASPDEVREVVYSYGVAQLEDLLHTKVSIPSTNRMARFLIDHRRHDLIRYLILARMSEEVSTHNPWDGTDTLVRLQDDDLYETALRERKQTRSTFLKNRYAFQLCKLAFYGLNEADCVRWADTLAKTRSAALKARALAYKGGILFGNGKHAKSAYAFSLAFAAGASPRKTYQSFLWSTNDCDASLKPSCLALCKNPKERAYMHALFALNGMPFRLAELRTIWAIDPVCPLLPLLCNREVSKLEERYLTPRLAREPGGKPFYDAGWNFEFEKMHPDGGQLSRTRAFLEACGKKGRVNRSFYLTAASYLAFMGRDYERAGSLLDHAQALPHDNNLRDQQYLIRLLLIANARALTPQLEARLLPSLAWMKKKALTHREYQVFYRNFFSEILAQRYEQRKDRVRVALSYAAADMSLVRDRDKQDYGGYYYSYWNDEGISYLWQEMSTADLLRLHRLYTSQHTTPYERFLLTNASFTRGEVVNVIGTSYLREFNFARAAEWLQKTPSPSPLFTYTEYYDRASDKFIKDTTWVNPFNHYINDWNRFEDPYSVPFTKLDLARRMLGLQRRISEEKNAEDRARLCFVYANGLYNMSYYGNCADEMVDYRPLHRVYTGRYREKWRKEYYGVITARSYYEKAYRLTADRELKAKCFFQMAKCSQRQIPAPAPNRYFDSEDSRSWKNYNYQYRNNSLFPQYQKEFGDTKFYALTLQECSYLRDFVDAHP